MSDEFYDKVNDLIKARIKGLEGQTERLIAKKVEALVTKGETKTLVSLISLCTVEKHNKELLKEDTSKLEIEINTKKDLVRKNMQELGYDEEHISKLMGLLGNYPKRQEAKDYIRSLL